MTPPISVAERAKPPIVRSGAFTVVWNEVVSDAAAAAIAVANAASEQQHDEDDQQDGEHGIYVPLMPPP
jgi:hypothetical protein